MRHWFNTFYGGALWLVLFWLMTGNVVHGQRADELARLKTDLMTQALRARSQGDHATARDALRELLALNPDEPAVKRMLSEINEAIDQTLGETQTDIDEIRLLVEAEARRLAAAPALAQHTKEEATALMRNGRDAEASAVVRKALEGPPLPPPIQEDLEAFLTNIEATRTVAPDPSPPSRAPTVVKDRAYPQEPTDDKASKEARIVADIAPHIQATVGQKSGAMGRQVTRELMLEDVSAGWRRKDSNRETQRDGVITLSRPGLESRLHTIHVPRISFTAAPLSQILDALADLAEEQGAPVNLLLLRRGGEDPLVDITLRDLSLDRVLSYLAESAGYEHYVEKDAVVLRPASSPSAYLRTEFFPINRPTIIRLTGMGAIESPPSDPYIAGIPSLPSQAIHQSEEAALLSFLERAGASFSTVPGATLALADGQVIVTQTPGNLKKVQKILGHYREAKQVEIEARFLEVQEGVLEEFGVEWLINNLARANKGEQLYRSQNRSLARSFGGDAVEGELIITGLGDGVGTDGTIRQPIRPPEVRNGIDIGASALGLAEIAGVVGDFDVDAIIRALARQTGNDLMSAPRVTVLSGGTAEIVVAQEMIYPRSFGDVEASVGRGSSLAGSAGVAVTAGTPRDFVTRNVGVEMQVTPVVEEDNSITLLLEPTVTEFEGFVEYGGPSVAIAGGTTVTVPSGFFQPVFSIRRVKTEVMLWDGATVVMGGLTREQAVTVKDKVPLLGDIPLLGRLFRSEGESTQKKNLLIFVTARLVDPGGAPVRQ